jgi:hypothetical protein
MSPICHCGSSTDRGHIMVKKTQPARGFWSWLLGNGWGQTGNGG